MKFLSAVNRYLILAAGVLTGAVSCTDDPEQPQSDIKVSIEVTSKTYSSVSFTLKAEGGTPTLYAYTAVEKGSALTAQQVYDEGVRAAVQAEPYILTELNNNTEYTLYAVAMGQNGLSKIASVEFTTNDDPGAPATSQSIGVRLNEITQTGVNYTLQRGSEVTGGFMAIWSKAVLDNYVEEQIRIENTLTREDVVAGLLQTGYGMEIDGTEQNADWLAEKLNPDADYTVMILATVQGNPTGVTLVDFHTPAFELIGDPTVKLSLENKDYMMAWIRYTLNKDAFGYMRFITDKSEIDRYLKTHTEDELREFVRFSDPMFEQLQQRYIDLTDFDQQGNAYKVSSTNFGFEAAEHEYTALAVACDRQYSVPKELARLDFRLDKFPEGTAPALFTCEARNIAANNFDLHFELDKSCMEAYCTVLPANQGQIADELAYSRKLWEEGWAMHRVDPSDPNSPLANQDDMFTDVYPGQEYVIVATGLNYQRVLNEKLTFSEPFRMKEYTYENSEALITLEVDQIEKTSARAIYRTGEKTRMLYNVTLEADDKFLNESDEATLRTYLLQHGNEWPYFHEKDEAWDQAVKSVVYTWTELTPGKEYVILACGQDTEGRISPVSRIKFTTQAAIPGPNPEVQLSAHDLTPVSCKIDILVNEDVREYIYAMIEEGVLNYVPGVDGQDVLEKEIYTITRGQGVVGYDSKRNMDTSGLTIGGTYYLGAIAYGSGTAESFKYIKVQLPDQKMTALKQLSSLQLSRIDPIRGGEEKTFEARREANLQAVDRSPINAEGVAYVRNAEDAENVLEQIGGYRSMRDSKAALRQMKKF